MQRLDWALLASIPVVIATAIFVSRPICGFRSGPIDSAATSCDLVFPVEIAVGVAIAIGLAAVLLIRARRRHSVSAR
jgi:hypothetical protein